jgi:hypothetical protein
MVQTTYKTSPDFVFYLGKNRFLLVEFETNSLSMRDVIKNSKNCIEFMMSGPKIMIPGQSTKISPISWRS